MTALVRVINCVSLENQLRAAPDDEILMWRAPAENKQSAENTGFQLIGSLPVHGYMPCVWLASHHEAVLSSGRYHCFLKLIIKSIPS